MLEIVNLANRNKPTDEQLAEPGNIYAIIWGTKQEAMKRGVSLKTFQNYIYDGFDKILRGHIEQGLTLYSKLLTEQMVKNMRTRFEEGKINRGAFQTLRQIALMLDEYNRFGNVERRNRVSDWGFREIGGVFREQLEMFCAEAERRGIWGRSRISSSRSAARKFLFTLEEAEIQDFTQLTLKETSDCISRIAQELGGGLKTFMGELRAFLRFLYANGVTASDLSIAIPEIIASTRKIASGFSPSEIENVLNMINRQTVSGNRDYAIMTLAAQTGLRSIDIVNLKRENIDWWHDEIRIVQNKTGVAIALPLEPAGGNAIAEYMLNYRPVSDLPYIFLTKNMPYRQLNAGTIRSQLRNYLKKANLCAEGEDKPQYGFHSFRRSFGTKLLNAGIPLEMLQQLLGHVHLDSAKPYLAIDEVGLKECALDLYPL